MAELTAESVRNLLDYDPETGALKWKVDRRSVRAGAIAGSITRDGYRRVGIDGASYSAHRVAWLHFYGKKPEHQVDHINGDRLDNRISNIRDVSGKLNIQNQRRPHSRNKAKLLGVTTLSKSCFVAKINGMHIGCFKTPELAHAAYLEAKREMHPGNTL